MARVADDTAYPVNPPALTDRIPVVKQAGGSPDAADPVEKMDNAGLLALLDSNTSNIKSGAAAPATAPDRVGQIYIKTGAPEAVYLSTGTSLVADWYELFSAAQGSAVATGTPTVSDRALWIDDDDSDAPKESPWPEVFKLITEAFTVAISDETTDLTTGAGKVSFRMPYAMDLTSVRLSAVTAPTGTALIVDVNEGGSSIFSTVPRIDAGDTTSVGSLTPGVISDAAIADDALITIDIDQIGSTVAGAGLKVTLIGTRA